MMVCLSVAFEVVSESGLVVVERRCHLRNGMLQEEQQRWW